MLVIGIMFHRNGYLGINRILDCVATMSSKKDHELMDNWDSCLSLIKQSSAKGISAQELAKKLGKHRTTIHSYLTSLELRGQVESKHGLWYPKEVIAKIAIPKENSTEKEIIIKLPAPKNEVNRMILLEHAARLSSQKHLQKVN